MKYRTKAWRVLSLTFCGHQRWPAFWSFFMRFEFCAERALLVTNMWFFQKIVFILGTFAQCGLQASITRGTILSWAFIIAFFLECSHPRMFAGYLKAEYIPFQCWNDLWIRWTHARSCRKMLLKKASLSSGRSALQKAWIPSSVLASYTHTAKYNYQ